MPFFISFSLSFDEHNLICFKNAYAYHLDFFVLS